MHGVAVLKIPLGMFAGLPPQHSLLGGSKAQDQAPAIARLTEKEFVDTVKGGYRRPRLKLARLRSLHHMAQISIGIP